MAAPSQVQIGALAGLQGLTEGFGGGMDASAQAKKANALQMAIERRAEEADQRNGLPAALAWKLALKTTGSDPNTPMPADFRAGRQLSQSLLQSGTGMYGVDNKKFAPPRVPVKDAHATELKNATLYTKGVKAVKDALGKNFHGDFTHMTPQQAEMAQKIFKGAVGPSYTGGEFLTSTAAVPGTGLRGFLGFGQATKPASTNILDPNYGGGEAAADPDLSKY